jgi:Skp family chaperone for outer membrane proteins
VLSLAASMVSWAAGETTHASTWDKFKAFTYAQKNEAVAEGKRLIAATDKQIAELSKQAKAAPAAVKAENKKNLKELQAKKKEAQAQLAKLQKSASGTWDATKDGFSSACKDLQQAYDKAAAAAKK